MKKVYALAAVAVLLVVPYVVAGWNELPVDDDFRRQAPGQFASLTDGQIHYRWLGDEDAEVVVLVHGVSVPNYVFAQLAEALVASGYRVLLFDQFGHGFSDRPVARYGVEFFDRQMVELFDSLDVVRPVHIGALSMGGVIAAEFAARRPERVKTLTLFAPAGLQLVNKEDSAFVKALKSPVLGNWMWRIIARRYYYPPQEDDELDAKPDPESGEKLQGIPERQADYAGYLMAQRQIFRHLPLSDRSDAFTGVAAAGIPVLGLFGDADETVDLASAELLKSLVPSARVDVIPTATHHLIVHNWRELHTAMVAFLHHNSAVSSVSSGNGFDTVKVTD